MHQGLRNGIVGHQLVNGRKMIDRHRLEQRWKGLSELEVFAQRANASLDCKAWGPPPWSAEQWQTLRVVIEPTSEALVSRSAKMVMALQVLLAILMLTVLIARAVSSIS